MPTQSATLTILEEIKELHFACISADEAKKMLKNDGHGVVYYARMSLETKKSGLV